MENIKNFDITKYDFNSFGKRKKIVDCIFSLDLETTSMLSYNGKIYPACEYVNFKEKEKKDIEYLSCFYLGMVGINDEVFYFRKFDELDLFFSQLDKKFKGKKIFFIHNLSFDFQFLSGYFEIKSVFARTKRKLIYCVLEKYNIEFRCTYFMSHDNLDHLAKSYKLHIKKLVGDLDYSLLRSPETLITENELAYGENDILIIYYYIDYLLKKFPQYNLQSLPKTKTGFVRKDLKKRIDHDYEYFWKTKKAVNADPHIYNLLLENMQGGYTHSNFMKTDKIISDVTSYDFTSSYPYVMCAYKFPMSEFKECYVNDLENLLPCFAYIFRIKFTKIKSILQNRFISKSKCRNIYNSYDDNGRIFYADSLEITLNDIDFEYIKKSYSWEKYEILEIHYAKYDFLPIQIVNFILEKYINKTKLKNVEGEEVSYLLEKNDFNSIFGMCLTNTIRNHVIYDNYELWDEKPMSNDEILKELNKQKNKPFLSFAWGNWILSIARNNLLQCIIEADESVCYCDTDSMKVTSDFDLKIVENYNKKVIERLKNVSIIREIDFEKFKPKDIKGIDHMLGVFDKDAEYSKFKTLGAKKYAYIYKGENEIKYTIAGVPKRKNALKSLKDFKDGYIFKAEIINKNISFYIDSQPNFFFEDYQGNLYECTDKKGICIVPTTYQIGLSDDYKQLLGYSETSERNYYNEK